MAETEVKINALKCPICDFNHNYVVKIEYLSRGEQVPETLASYYNSFITEESVGGSVIQVPVYEIDAFCLKTKIPFRIIVDPKIPVDSIPVKFSVEGVP
jgi:hypothetical protein